MSRETSTFRSESSPLTTITERQVDILRLLGKGNSFKDVSQQFTDQNIGVEVRKELRGIYASFGVISQTAAVVHALNTGLLRTEELVEEDFDWGLFKTLKGKEGAILEAFTHTRGQSLTEEEFNALNVETIEDPKTYVARSITRARERVGLGNKTQTVVYYYAYRERQQEQGDVIVPAAKKILRNREIQVLEWLAKGLSDRVIANNRWAQPIQTRTVYRYKRKIFAKLGVTNIEEATKKARELGILKS